MASAVTTRRGVEHDREIILVDRQSRVALRPSSRPSRFQAVADVAKDFDQEADAIEHVGFLDRQCARGDRGLHDAVEGCEARSRPLEPQRRAAQFDGIVDDMGLPRQMREAEAERLARRHEFEEAEQGAPRASRPRPSVRALGRGEADLTAQRHQPGAHANALRGVGRPPLVQRLRDHRAEIVCRGAELRVERSRGFGGREDGIGEADGGDADENGGDPVDRGVEGRKRRIDVGDGYDGDCVASKDAAIGAKVAQHRADSREHAHPDGEDREQHGAILREHRREDQRRDHADQGAGHAIDRFGQDHALRRLREDQDADARARGAVEFQEEGRVIADCQGNPSAKGKEAGALRPRHRELWDRQPWESARRQPRILRPWLERQRSRCRPLHGRQSASWMRTGT